MPTQWFYPNQIEQYAEVPQHVSWRDDGNGFQAIKYLDNDFLEATAPLLHIANTLVNDVKMKTYFLSLKEFNIVAEDAVTGIEVEITMHRGGRITDDTIQLQLQGQYIGNNRAADALAPTTVYGGAGDLWGANNISASMLMDTSFGIILRYQSHPSWPHRETPAIDCVRLRLW